MKIPAESLDPRPRAGEPTQERSLRPSSLDEFVGQERLKENLRIQIRAARKRGEPLEHLLFYGPPGLGKTTLAQLLAREMESELIATSGPALERAGDLVGLLTSLGPGGLLFVDEIHRVPRTVEEYLYAAMEDFQLDILLDRGPAARSVRLTLAPFTLVGATTRVGLLTAPLRGRFGFTGHLDFYAPPQLGEILRRSARLLRLQLTAEAEALIASRSRGTPRIANRLLRRVRDYVEAHDADALTAELAARALALLRIDDRGLHEMDRRLLEAIAGKFGGGPVGLATLAAVLGEEEDTLEDLLEPFLLREGYIERTRRGRTLTRLGFEAVGLAAGGPQESLL
ncbi:MAG: Holliday junction branch migration DNA helicase RuvB [Candidatus Eisenbacteria bacterium]|nr:Holliday junction branch migration DNA helicase RuvB [Candidatus Eisenbacteria bacterium]